MVISGIATMDQNATKTMAIPSGGRSVIRLGVPTIDSSTITFEVQPFPTNDVATGTFRTLKDDAGNTITVTASTGGFVVDIPELAGAYAFKIVTAAQTSGAVLFEVQAVGPYPSPSGSNKLTIEGGTVTVTGTVTANLGTPVTATTALETGVAASATSGTVLASNASRKGCLITNSPTSSTLYLRFSSSAATIASGGYSVVLTPGQTYEMGPNVYSGQINGIWASATGFANVTEF
jgi:hypothetical protein